jgi:hypothetical protein
VAKLEEERDEKGTFNLYDSFAAAYGEALVDCIASSTATNSAEAIFNIASRCNAIISRAAVRNRQEVPTCAYTRAFVLAGLDKIVQHLINRSFQPTPMIQELLQSIARLGDREKIITAKFLSEEINLYVSLSTYAQFSISVSLQLVYYFILFYLFH